MAQSYRVGRLRPQVQCVLIADDLTGACDAAAPFYRQGASVRVALDSEKDISPETDVLAFSTGSRDLPAAEMHQRLWEIAAQLKRKTDPGFIIFKKIDSTLRGNPGEEIAAALEAFHCDVAVITPAFPAMGRHVQAGYLHNNRDPAWQPIHVESLLQAQGLHSCHHVVPEILHTTLAGSCRFVSLETAGDKDLRTIVAEALHCGKRILWVGSAGLASALAPTLFRVARPNPANPPRRDAPVLFVIGSDHVVTLSQIARLSERYSIGRLDADSTSQEHLATTLRSHRHIVLALGRHTTSSGHLTNLMRCARQLAGALLLSGGDTASLVCAAICAQAISLAGEIVTGLPWGILEGGLFENVPVATKSGGFGAPDALIEVAEFFSCLAP